MANETAKAASKKDDDFFETGYQNEAPPSIDGWYSPAVAYDEGRKIGQTVKGQCVGLITLPGDDDRNMGPRDVVLVKLAEPCKADAGDGKQTVIDMKPGEVLGVGIRHNLKEMLNYVAHKGHVKFRATERENIGGGRKLQHFDFIGKGEKAPPPRAIVSTGAAPSGPLPF